MLFEREGDYDRLLSLTVRHLWIPLCIYEAHSSHLPYPQHLLLRMANFIERLAARNLIPLYGQISQGEQCRTYVYRVRIHTLLSF